MKKKTGYVLKRGDLYFSVDDYYESDIKDAELLSLDHAEALFEDDLAEEEESRASETKKLGKRQKFQILKVEIETRIVKVVKKS